MGLSNQSTGFNTIDSPFDLECFDGYVIALAGNPNVGKSTIFNQLTGLNQHTGNWPGKTVALALGKYTYHQEEYAIIDLPGTYSLMASSIEEEVASNFICFKKPDVTVVICDATSLQRNLNLVLQTTEITPNVILCINLMDEAFKKKITLNSDLLSRLLNIPIVCMSAKENKGFDSLMARISDIAHHPQSIQPLSIQYSVLLEKAISMLVPLIHSLTKGSFNSRWLALRLIDNNPHIKQSLIDILGFNLLEDEAIFLALQHIQKMFNHAQLDDQRLQDVIAMAFVAQSEKISSQVIQFNNPNYQKMDRTLDSVFTSKHTGIPIMLLLLLVILWITITGANLPSQFLSTSLFYLGDQFKVVLHFLHFPLPLIAFLIDGIYLTLAWVVSVMLPPMAIFFPLFTILEDLGYLPRIAFNLDRYFRACHTCGKQALTMCMGFGCNAVGVVGCRIIDSPRERLIAILTNNFVPCNGRFPTLIVIITMFFTGIFIAPFNSLFSALLLTLIILLGIFLTFIVSNFLASTLLKGIPSSFTLELPPYRKPQIGKILIRSLLDRTLFVLGRAVVTAIPAGALIWILANLTFNGLSLLNHISTFLHPFASLFGLDGVILFAFILGFPANEIVVPIIIMAYMSNGHMIELNNLNTLKTLLVDNGWTWLTAVCTLLFSLIHFPCATTCLTIQKETGSWKWTALSFIIPTLIGLFICFIISSLCRILFF